MKLASIEIITDIQSHPNADKLELAKVMGFVCIVKKGEFSVGEKIVFVQPDTVLPDDEWAKVFKAKSNRVKAIRLRGTWSEGIILSRQTLNLQGLETEGLEVSSGLGITKYEAPVPQDLQAKGGLPFGLPITDEERYQNIDPMPYGAIVDVTLKRDGKSWTAYAIKENTYWFAGICGRRLEYKLDAANDYTQFQDALLALRDAAFTAGKSLVIRGEITGQGVQSFAHNPHCQGPKTLRIFSVYLPDERKYAGKNDPFYYRVLAPKLNLATVELLEENVVLTPELIKKYAEDLEVVDGQPFEGVVIKGDDFSFKVINRHYDSKKA